MNYAKVPRELIYKDRHFLEEFGTDEPYTLNCELAQLMRQYLLSKFMRNNYRDILLDIFNEAYYLTTILLIDDNAYDNLPVYFSSVLRSNPYSEDLSKAIKKMVVALCYIYMEVPAKETIIFSTIRQHLRHYASEFIYMRLEVRNRRCPSPKEFAPVKLTEELLNAINWEKHTDGFKQERVKEFLDYLGQTKKEKRLLVKAIYIQLTNTDNLSSRTYTIDSFLLLRYREYGGSTWDFVNVQQEKLTDEPQLREILSYPDLGKVLHEQMMYKEKIQTLEGEKKILEESNQQLKRQLFELQVQFKQQQAKTLTEKEQKHREEQLQAQIEEMKKIISTLKGKLGNKAIQLKYIVDSIKNKAVFVGLKEAYELFELINSMLCEEPVWIENRHELQDFFKECKNKSNTNQTIMGDYVVSKHVKHEVSSVSAGGTGVIVYESDENIEV